MCRFGMTSHIDACDGPHGRVKKPTSFMTSSRRVAEQLARLCKGDHDHVQLIGGRAAGAQVYPKGLCEAMLRGIANQKQDDTRKVVSTSQMSYFQTMEYIGSLSSICLGTVDEVLKKGVQQGQWPSHWTESMHEEDGGNDAFGLRPQNGIDILKNELDALTFKDGISVAKDDVSGK